MKKNEIMQVDLLTLEGMINKYGFHAIQKIINRFREEKKQWSFKKEVLDKKDLEVDPSFTKKRNKIWAGHELILGRYNFDDFEYGDRVWIYVTRLSSSAWLRRTNKNHGWVLCRAEIVKDIENGGKEIVVNKVDIARWQKPIGKEKYNQAVNCSVPYYRFRYIYRKIT